MKSIPWRVIPGAIILLLIVLYFVWLNIQDRRLNAATFGGTVTLSQLCNREGDGDELYAVTARFLIIEEIRSTTFQSFIHVVDRSDDRLAKFTISELGNNSIGEIPEEFTAADVRFRTNSGVLTDPAEWTTFKGHESAIQSPELTMVMKLGGITITSDCSVVVPYFDLPENLILPEVGGTFDEPHYQR